MPEPLKKGTRVKYSHSYLRLCGTAGYDKHRGTIVSVSTSTSIIYGVRWDNQKGIRKHFHLNIEKA